jgi:dienelactone hydrolase
VTRRASRFRSAAVAACVGLVLLAAAPRAPAGPSEAFHGAGGVMGLLHVPPIGAPRWPAVLIVHDALGLDRRSDRYVAQLTAAGLLVLEVELRANPLEGEAEPLPGEAEAAGLVARVAAALARDPRVDPARIGALGFGVGARAVALPPPAGSGHAPFAARVLLYPGCGGLADLLRAAPARAPRPAAPPPPVLLLHGEDDPANTPAACEGLAAALGPAARRASYRGATYAWDLPQGGGGPCTAQPWPGRAGSRVAARAWPELAELAAATAAAALERALRPAAARLD